MKDLTPWFPKGTFSVDAEVDGERRTFTAGQLLVTTGRVPNTANMGMEENGVALDPDGFMIVDATMQSSVAGIYGAGNCAGAPAFVYTAAYEGALAATNALTGKSSERDYTALPWVIFTDPQVAGARLDERQAKAQGINAEATLLPLSHVPRALAAHDTRGFIQLIRDKQTDRLVAHAFSRRKAVSSPWKSAWPSNTASPRPNWPAPSTPT